MNQWRLKEGWCTARGADFTEKSTEFGKSVPLNLKVPRACAAPVMDIMWKSHIGMTQTHKVWNISCRGSFRLGFGVQISSSSFFSSLMQSPHCLCIGKRIWLRPLPSLPRPPVKGEFAAQKFFKSNIPPSHHCYFQTNHHHLCTSSLTSSMNKIVSKRFQCFQLCLPHLS